MPTQKPNANSNLAHAREQALALAEARPRISGPEDPMIQHLGAALTQDRAQARTAFDHKQTAFAYLKSLSAMADHLIQTLWQAALIRSGLKSAKICCIATGGYGRKELYPYSDIDLLILHNGQRDEAETLSTLLLHDLWDLGFKVGHACRSIEDCLTLARGDFTVATSLLDARYLCGTRTLHRQFVGQWNQTQQQIAKEAFIEAKLEERQQRLEKHGNSRFLLEPNLKENVGGLRDLHMLYWLARFCYQIQSVNELVKLGKLTPTEYRDFVRAHRFLATVRIHLHLLAGRADERLTFDQQKTIGELLGYRSHEAHQPVERFMKRYFQTARQVGMLTRTFSALLEEEYLPPPRFSLSRLFERNVTRGAYQIRGKRLNFTDAQQLDQNPLLLLDLFATAQAESLNLHPHAVQLVSRRLSMIDKEYRHQEKANTLFLQMLLSDQAPDLTLSRMNEVGLIGKFIPDFARLVGQIQYDRYHVFTVDEHTIRLIGYLHQIEQGELKDDHPLSSEIIHHIHSRRALYFAAFCHDIAKGRGGGHEKLGVQITYKLGKRFGLEPSEIELACWLVENHLLFSATAFSRDLGDLQTIIDFVRAVQSPERLRCLLLITVVDIRAVGPNIWNGWKGALLRDLYAHALAEMGTPLQDERMSLAQKSRDRLSKRIIDWPDAIKQLLLSDNTNPLWLSIPEEYHLSTAELLRQVSEDPKDIACDYTIHSFEAITHIRLCLKDYNGLLRDITGSVSIIGGSILSIRSVTLPNDLVIMLLDIQDKIQSAYENTARLNQFAKTIRSAQTDPTQFNSKVDRRRPKLSARHRAMQVAPVVYLDNQLSRSHTVVEVNATDRIGLLYDITGILTQLNLNITSSHITTYGEKAVDVFYVRDASGQKVTDEPTLAMIKSELLAMLAYRNWKDV